MSLVYSTETGRIKQPKATQPVISSDGIVRIQRQTKGRKGKGVCIITGLAIDANALKKLAKELKQVCGCGGAVKDGAIEIQGDKREVIKQKLESLGYTVRLSGG